MSGTTVPRQQCWQLPRRRQSQSRPAGKLALRSWLVTSRQSTSLEQVQPDFIRFLSSNTSCRLLADEQ